VAEPEKSRQSAGGLRPAAAAAGAHELELKAKPAAAPAKVERVEPARRPSMAERLEALLPADGLGALVRRLEQIRDMHREVEEEIHYRTNEEGRVVEWKVMHSYTARL